MRKRSIILYLHHWGPLLEYSNGILHVGNLNPDVTTAWRMRRMDMLRLAWRSFLAALF